MKARALFTAFAAVALIAACKPDVQPTDTFQAALTVSGVSGNSISVPAAGKDVTIKVAANISWAVANTAEWITIDPESYTNDNKETVETKVTVKVAENESEEAREATLTISADGIDPVAVTVKQAAKEAPAAVLEVFDVDKFEAVPDPSVELAGIAGAATITIHANVNWTATADEWITVDPASWTFDGENDLVSVNITATATEAERSGSVKFSAEGAELTVAVKQAAAATIGIEAVDADLPYSQIAFKITPATETEYYAYIYADKATVDEMGGAQALCDYMVSRRNSYLESYDASVIIDALCYTGTATYLEQEMDAETTYTVVACGIAYDETANAFYQSTLGASVDITTTAAPEASEAYSALLGTYQGTVYDYFEGANADLVLTVEPYGINESYLIGSPSGIISPVGSDGTYDTFEAAFDEANNKIVLPQAVGSSLGGYWNFNGIDGTCMIVLAAFYYQAEEDIESWGFTLSEDKTTLTAFTVPEVPEGDNLLFGGNIALAADGSSTGYAAGYAVVTGPFTRVEETAEALSVKNALVDPAVKNFKVLKAAGKIRK